MTLSLNGIYLAVAALAYIAPVAAQNPISSCPSATTSGTTTNGYSYQICLNSDYQGNSAKIIRNIGSTKACVQLCADDQQCVKAVYDKIESVCHFKADSGLTWTTSNNNKFDSATVAVTTIRSVIAKCPYTERVYTTTNGVKYQICGGTDFEGPTRQAINNVASNAACNQICEKTSGCTKTVYDVVGLVCHVKDDSGNLVWVTNRRFITSRIATTPPPATMGKWSDIVTIPVIPAAGYMVPSLPDSSRILFFASFSATAQGGSRGTTAFADYNFRTGAASARQVANTQHDMFCPGISMLGDGRIIVTGGDNAEATSIYDPVTNNFIKGPRMQIARGYQTSAALSDGKVFTIGGSYSGGIFNKPGEVYDANANTWTNLTGCDAVPMLTTYDGEGDWRRDNHAWLFGWRNGYVFQAGPSREMHWFGTSGTGSVTSAGVRDPDSDAMCGPHVMYDTGKIFAVSGTQSYTNSQPLSRAYKINIDAPNTAATVQRVADVGFARAFSNIAVLPDGTMLLTGGQGWPRVFSDRDSILVPELYNPNTNTWKRLASPAVPRNYHSISLLLPDATVMAAGGGLCYNPNADPNNGCDHTADHPNFEIFSPPYLFNSDGSAATRPVISSVVTAQSGYKVRVGSTLGIRMADSASGVTFSLIRLGSATHSINSDQRRISLSNVRKSGSTWTATLPSDSGILIPGYWYLFALSSSGVPSVAKTLQITL